MRTSRIKILIAYCTWVEYMIYSYNVKFQIFIYPQDHLFLPYGGHAICHLSDYLRNTTTKKTEACKYYISVALEYCVQICTNSHNQHSVQTHIQADFILFRAVKKLNA